MGELDDMMRRATEHEPAGLRSHGLTNQQRAALKQYQMKNAIRRPKQSPFSAPSTHTWGGGHDYVGLPARRTEMRKVARDFRRKRRKERWAKRKSLLGRIGQAILRMRKKDAKQTTTDR